MALAIDGQSRVPIPADIVEQLGLQPGMEMDVRVRGKCIIVSRAGDDAGCALTWDRPTDGFIASVARLAGEDLEGLATLVDQAVKQFTAGFIEDLRRGLAAHADVAARLDRVIALTLKSFRDPEVSRTWLMRRHPMLGWMSPLAIAVTEDGAQEVEGVLFRLRSGGAV
ncbi:antitoxin Xre/MbcA/ParS toxin-binding domain-containing protein [Roseomonas harenae]|uniref:antitoxin Xre/MbcA/ParS toxin-binding domain-containing protein n=1 Tax=Muricoccus harenae TaxID=2692566 RepID=UPI001331736F|nr:antitoxin Xre/MbcA/ParS toxin-binding domain-containing protein [Roseomonas harenae]